MNRVGMVVDVVATAGIGRRWRRLRSSTQPVIFFRTRIRGALVGPPAEMPVTMRFLGAPPTGGVIRDQRDRAFSSRRVGAVPRPCSGTFDLRSWTRGPRNTLASGWDYPFPVAATRIDNAAPSGNPEVSGRRPTGNGDGPLPETRRAGSSFFPSSPRLWSGRAIRSPRSAASSARTSLRIGVPGSGPGERVGGRSRGRRVFPGRRRRAVVAHRGNAFRGEPCRGSRPHAAAAPMTPITRPAAPMTPRPVCPQGNDSGVNSGPRSRPSRSRGGPKKPDRCPQGNDFRGLGAVSTGPRAREFGRLTPKSLALRGTLRTAARPNRPRNASSRPLEPPKSLP